MIAKPNYSAASVERFFYFLVSLALLCFVLSQMINGTWQIHTGELFPWRHFRRLPLLPAYTVAVRWALLVFSTFLILIPSSRRLGLWLASACMLLGLTQQFSNHASLIFLVLFYLSITSAKQKHYSYQMIRYQLMIVYFFSALNKFDHGFYRGETLASLGKSMPSSLLPLAWQQFFLSEPLVVPISWLVIALELALPVLLLKYPKPAVVMVLFFHVGMSLVMPGIWSFTLIMFAMSVLFLLPDSGLKSFFRLEQPARSPGA